MSSARHMFILAAALTVGGAGVACRSGVAKFSDADAAAIRSATRRYVEMDEASNSDLLQLIAEDAVYMPPGIAPLEGRNAVERLFKTHSVGASFRNASGNRRPRRPGICPWRMVSHFQWQAKRR